MAHAQSLPPLQGVAQVSAGGFHTCALSTRGGVACWGSNNAGRLGDGSTIERPIPVDATGLGSGISAVASGRFHTCALTNSGGVKCWGANSQGQFGDGTTTLRMRPLARPTTPQQCAGTVGGNSNPQIDYSGTRNVFESSLQLAATDKNPLPDVYLLDLASSEITPSSSGTSLIGANGAAREPRISGDGRTASFGALARNLLPRDADNNEVEDIHLYSTRTGSVTRLDRGRAGAIADARSTRPALDCMGKAVAFESNASFLVVGQAVAASNVFLSPSPHDPNARFGSSFE